MASMPVRRLRTTLNVFQCRCLRCGHTWKSIGTEPPKSCANCKSKSWNVPPGTLKPGRQPKKPGARS
jgi:predicted Zn-ribbon and HTH transcriptional regulator